MLSLPALTRREVEAPCRGLCLLRQCGPRAVCSAFPHSLASGKSAASSRPSQPTARLATRAYMLSGPLRAYSPRWPVPRTPHIAARGSEHHTHTHTHTHANAHKSTYTHANTLTCTHTQTRTPVLSLGASAIMATGSVQYPTCLGVEEGRSVLPETTGLRECEGMRSHRGGGRNSGCVATPDCTPHLPAAIVYAPLTGSESMHAPPTTPAGRLALLRGALLALGGACTLSLFLSLSLYLSLSLSLSLSLIRAGCLSSLLYFLLSSGACTHWE